MRASEFKDKEVMLFFKEKDENVEIESSTVLIIDEVIDFGLYVEYEDGNKEVVAYTELSGWKETNQED